MIAYGSAAGAIRGATYMKTLLATCLVSVCTVGLPSQTTWLVGPGGLPQIRDAVALAASGDEILVQAGTYAHFVCTRPMTIRAQVPGTVAVDYNVAFMTPGCSLQCLATEGPTTIAPQGAGVVHVVGLRFLGSALSLTPYVTARHRVLVAGGVVHFDRCTFGAVDTVALTITAASVQLQDCVATVAGNGTPSSAIRAFQATVTAVQTQARANPTVFASTTTAGSGIELAASTLHGCHLDLVGSSGGLGSGGPALGLQNNARAFVADSTLVGGHSRCAVVADAGAVALDRCSVSASGAGCNSHLSSTPLLAVHRSQPLRLGQATTFAFTGAPLAPVFVYHAFELGPTTTHPALAQPLWLGGSSLQFAALRFGDAQGRSTFVSNVHPQPAFVGLPLFCQGLAFGAAELQLSPVSGGKVE